MTHDCSDLKGFRPKNVSNLSIYLRIKVWRCYIPCSLIYFLFCFLKWLLLIISVNNIIGVKIIYILQRQIVNEEPVLILFVYA